MRGLLDTHALLWWIFDDPSLSQPAREAIADPRNEIFVSSASAWEISIKAHIGKLPEAGDVPERLPDYVRQSKFKQLAITLEHALAAGALPMHHNDPFDRALIAQAKLEDLSVVTRDPAFAAYGVEVVW